MVDLSRREILTGGNVPVRTIETPETERVHPLYAWMLPQWRFFLAAYEGGRAFTAESGYLFSHQRETPEDRAFRLRRVVYYNYCRSIIDVYLSHLYKKGVLRESSSLRYREFLQDVDLCGSDADSFMTQSVAPLAFALGTVFVVVDMPPAGGDYRSRGDELAAGLRPYARFLMPMDVVDWETDSLGAYRWIKIREEHSQAREITGGSKKTQVRYRVWTPEKWFLLDENDNYVNPHGASGEPHPVGRVPVVKVMCEKSLAAPDFGISFLQDIAPIAQKIYNLASLLDEFLYKQCFSFLAWPGEIHEERLGASNVANFDPESGSPPVYVTPPTDPAKFLESQIARNIEEIYRLARIEYAGNHPRVAQSGFAKAIDFHDTNNMLAKKASHLEAAERAIARIFFRWTGEKAAANVIYPREFNVKAINDEIAEAIQALSLGIAPTFVKHVKRRLAARFLPNLEEKERRKIENEIEKSSEYRVSSSE
ncbi:MAG: hypothetical protein E3J72_08065 [Planctomycetota bacterium]|nr:MAG: hypothetical protein E3J72_08065 [Planctomycetota bacterium]